MARRKKRLWTDEETQSICFQVMAPAAAAADNHIEIELAGGHRMRIIGSYDPEALARLIRGLTALFRFRPTRGSGWRRASLKCAKALRRSRRRPNTRIPMTRTPIVAAMSWSVCSAISRISAE